MKYSCIIIDDEPLSHDVLKNHLASFPELQLKGTFFNAKDARDFLEGNAVDILLLDIEMPEINGLDFLRSLNEKPVSIITTAYRDYAVEGFELGVIDYLMKPIPLERFEISLKRAIDFLQLVKTDDSIEFSEANRNYEIPIKTGTKRVLLDYRKIIFAQGLKDYTILHTETEKYVVKGSVKAFESYLPGNYFVRVHKSFIVAIPRIKIARRNKIELGQLSIPIGRAFKSKVDEILRNGKSIEY
jgi:DNA-binding LytR/AlgR family response regulator